MTDLLLAGRPNTAQGTVPRIAPVSLLYVVTIASVAAGLYVASRSTPSGSLEWQLELLLRFMAAIKAAMVLGAIGLIHWRLRTPIPGALTAGYVGGIALMSMAPPMIWSLAHIALGAGLFHAGLLVVLFAAWRDDAPTRLFSRPVVRR